LFDEIISLPNLFRAWRTFRRGKTRKTDVGRFEFTLEDNIFKLHRELLSGTYTPESYASFYVKDPKLRHIHKASVRDRVLYQAVFAVLYGIFDEHFIFDSYSSRNGKGTHAGNERVEDFLRKATANWTRGAYALKCDVRKFFDSIDHEILFSLIQNGVSDKKTLALIRLVLKSFEKSSGKGLPLGNVTSQLFANMYMNEFDQYVKHELKAVWYARYCDDFVIVNQSKETLKSYILKIREFLLQKLVLDLHPNKISLRKARQGIDFLGYVILPHRKVLRIKTKNRMLKKITEENEASYKGILSHCKGKRIEREIDAILQK